MLDDLKSKLSNPKRALEWTIKLAQDHTFEELVDEVNSASDPTNWNPRAKRKRSLTFHEGDGRTNVLLRHDSLRRKDHSVAFDTWHNVMTYSQDRDLYFTKKYCIEIEKMRKELNAQIVEIDKKERKAKRGIRERYSNRFKLSFRAFYLQQMHGFNSQSH